MNKLGTILMAFTLAGAARAEIVAEDYSYRDGDVALKGYLVSDDEVRVKRPGVLVVHEWWGLNDFAKAQARALVGLGYVALAVDMYGDGKVTDDPAEAGKLAGQFRNNPALWRARAKAAYDALRKDERVDPDRIAAIGFCFGGSTVLQMAAAGLDLAGVVSFHGGLMPFSAEDAARIKTRILVLHGAADTTISEENLKGFEDSLRKSTVDWQMIIYSGAKHSFTNPASDKMHAEGVGYNAAAARRSWEHMRLFLDEVFRPRQK